MSGCNYGDCGRALAVRQIKEISHQMKKFMSILGPTIMTSAVVMQGTLSIAQMSASMESPSNETIRPFKVHVPKKDLDDLRKLILATRWPDKETVSDQSQGVPLDKLQALMHYWGTGYDWRKAEAKLNALPQFVTHIDGVNIYFIHVRSKEPNAMPLIITHGWPGSIFEMLKIIGPLTNPTAYGGKPEDAFDVVIPSLPGYGFSGKPVTNSIELKWTSASEINCNRYEIEYSADGKRFDKIGVLVSVNATNGSSYFFRDNNGKADKNWYRLKIVDMDARYKYSAVILVSNKELSESKVFYNFSNNQIITQFPLTNQSTIMKLVGIDGTLYRQYFLPARSSEFRLTAVNLPVGSYILVWINGNHIYSRKFVKW